MDADSYPVHNMYSNVKDSFCLLPSINKQQKIIFIKKLLTRAPLKFIQCQWHLMAYNAFKNGLLNEFENTISSSDLHKMLRSYKLHKMTTDAKEKYSNYEL